MTTFERTYLARWLKRNPTSPLSGQDLHRYLFHRNARGQYTHSIVRECYAMWQEALCLAARVGEAA